MVNKIFELPDSGKRRLFETGSKRDISTGKGRMDLVPSSVLAMLYEHKDQYTIGSFESKDQVSSVIFKLIDNYIYTGNIMAVIDIIVAYGNFRYGNLETTILEVSRHFEAGANKYDARNWEKGQPLHVYVDSGLRHLVKWLRGDNDEPHDGAFVWNMVCLVWTHYNLHDMHDLPFNPMVKDGKRV